MWTSTLVRSRWLRNRVPSPWPVCAPSISPGTSATTNVRSPERPTTPRFGIERREGVVGDLRPRRGDARDQRRLSGIGKADQPDVRQQLQMKPEVLLFAGKAGLRSTRRAIGGGREAGVAVPAEASLRDQDTLTFRGEVGDLHVLVLAPLVDGGADRHREIDVRAGAARYDWSLRHARRVRLRRVSGNGN